MSKVPYLTRKFQDFQRSTARGYICPVCTEAFQQEPILWQHAKSLHADSLGYPDVGGEAEARKQFKQQAVDKAQKTSRKNTRHTPPTPSRPPSNDDDSTRPNVGDGMGSSLSRPTSAPAPTRVAEKEIQNIDKLTITQGLVTDVVSNPRISPPPTSIPLNRGSGGYSGLPEPELDRHNVGKTTPRSRHAKTQSGGPFVGKDPDFDREALVASEFTLPRSPFGTAKRLFDPNNDNTGLAPAVRKNKHQEQGSPARRMHDSKSHMFRSKRTVSDSKGDFLPRVECEQGSPLVQHVGYDDKSLGNPRSAAYQAPLVAPQEADSESEPTMIPQPETRPISHDQLVVEVKGIYAGLVMVEAKCIEVDENQSVAAQEKDPSRKNKLSNEQWQALIALHKQLLHEHHDFFLASQHPSASPALSRLAAKYSMPARMWRHGIHAFLEVLRHRLPESLDHMLAFIYIAYSMMALLYETVSTFEDTWIECLGDLARYRMAIEDDDIRDREVWSGVARFWYSKAADKSPNVGRLYHHLAILARPNSLQQLSLYTKSLTCVTPFENARGSIMTLFTPILHSKESTYQRSPSLEIVFIKAHATLFSGGPFSELDNALQQLQDGLLDNYIGRVTAKFKEQGVFAAVTNIAALLEYGALKQRGLHKSVVRLAFEEISFQRKQRTSPRTTHPSAEYLAADDDATHDSPLTSSIQSTFGNLTASEIKSSEIIISYASKITFLTLSISLRRIGDKNVFPLIHVSFVFLWSLVIVEKAMKYVERDVPWEDICSFLNTLARPEAMTPRVWGEGFPESSDGVGRPLPEDFVLRGQLYSQSYLPENWFQEAMIDDEERALELPSMAALRVERILWLGIRIACCDRWIRFDKESHKFAITKYGVALLSPPDSKTNGSPSTLNKAANADVAMPDALPTIDNSSIDFKIDKDQLDQYPAKGPNLRKLEDIQRNDKDIVMADTGLEKIEPKNYTQKPAGPDPVSGLNNDLVLPKTTSSPEVYHRPFISDTSKVEAMIDFDSSEIKELVKL